LARKRHIREGVCCLDQIFTKKTWWAVLVFVDGHFLKEQIPFRAQIKHQTSNLYSVIKHQTSNIKHQYQHQHQHHHGIIDCPQPHRRHSSDS